MAWGDKALPKRRGPRRRTHMDTNGTSEPSFDGFQPRKRGRPPKPPRPPKPKPPEREENFTVELIATAVAIGYDKVVVLKALAELRVRVGDREAHCRLIDAMVERRLIYNELGQCIC